MFCCRRPRNAGSICGKAWLFSLVNFICCPIACQLFHPENCCAKIYLILDSMNPPVFRQNPGLSEVFAAPRIQCVPKIKGAQREDGIAALFNTSPLLIFSDGRKPKCFRFRLASACFRALPPHGQTHHGFYKIHPLVSHYFMALN
ncbi:hypothetical protein BDR07DRAFT_532235 [Suillus spraguei]|nr:hypothetical protein BDR07DRAFT_532235 [Suillus spraguei]